MLVINRKSTSLNGEAMKTPLVVLTLLVGAALAQENPCWNTTCALDRNCRCMLDDTPGGLQISQVPQFVMLTFDDAVNSANFEPTYNKLFLGQNKNPSNCSIGATFFVSHEYNNYAELHHLWRSGSEIAVHTITHETSTDMWRSADYARWRDEAVGMRKIISKYGLIPEGQIQGFRAPFLQTAGDTTFQMLKNEGFTYDSSMSTRAHAGENANENPIWPYTLDYGFTQDCIIHPCPENNYNNLWIVPMVSYFRERVMIDGRPPVMMPCAMADACLPWPTTQADTFNYFLDNFNRHYQRNRAPFPVFLHESWLKEPGRKDGYVQFLEYLLEKDDVFVVTIQEVLDFIRNPRPLSLYKESRCVEKKERESCPVIGKYCYIETTNLGGSRALFSCTPKCPTIYPWLHTIE